MSLFLSHLLTGLQYPGIIALIICNLYLDRFIWILLNFGGWMDYLSRGRQLPPTIALLIIWLVHCLLLMRQLAAVRYLWCGNLRLAFIFSAVPWLPSLAVVVGLSLLLRMFVWVFPKYDPDFKPIDENQVGERKADNP